MVVTAIGNNHNDNNNNNNNDADDTNTWTLPIKPSKYLPNNNNIDDCNNRNNKTVCAFLYGIQDNNNSW